MARTFQRIQAKNVLSFGDKGIDLELRNLNVLIGPNGSGKSNLISLFSLLRQAPSDLSRAFSGGGGINEWLWKGGKGDRTAVVKVGLDSLEVGKSLFYSLRFGSRNQRMLIQDEQIGIFSQEVAYEIR